MINGIGRTLSEPIISKLNNPPANVSSMDGYAVKNSDLEKGIYKFYCIDESIAGKKSIKTIKSGETVRIYTGAIIPLGADRVILQENTLVKSRRSWVICCYILFFMQRLHLKKKLLIYQML